MECKLCTVAMDEIISVRESLSYNVEKDPIEGFEDFGSQGRTQYVANRVTPSMVRGVCCPSGRSLGVFSLQWTICYFDNLPCY